MKYIIALLICAGVGFAIFNADSFITTQANSESMGISFMHSTSYIASISPDDTKITLSRSSLSQDNQHFSITVTKIPSAGLGPNLSYMLDRLEANSTQKTETVHNGISGIDFDFPGASGEEKGFAFESGSAIIVVATQGYSIASSKEKHEFDRVLGTLRLL